MSDKELKHWFLFSYQHGLSSLNMVCGISYPIVTQDVMDRAKKSIKPNGDWVLISVSSLGACSQEEFNA